MPIEQLLNLYGAYPPKDDETNERNGDFLETENGNNDDGPDNYEMENENIGEEDVEDADTGASRSSGSDENLNSTDMDKVVKHFYFKICAIFVIVLILNPMLKWKFLKYKIF